MANKVQVIFEIDKDAQGRTTLKQIESGITRLGRASKQAGSEIDAGLSFVKSAVLVEFFRRGAQEALAFGVMAVKAFNEAQAAAKGLEGVARFKGLEPSTVLETVQNLDLVKNGLLTVGDASATLKNLLQTGFSLPEAIKLMKVFGDSAAFNRQASLGFGEAIVRTSEGIRLGLSTLADGVGVAQNLGQMLKAAGIDASELSNLTQNAAARQAIANGFTREAAASMGDAAKLTQTFSGEQAKLEAIQQKLLITLGELITKNPQLGNALKSAGESLEYITTQLKDTDSQLSKFVNNSVSGIAGLIQIVSKLGKSLEPIAFILNSFPDLGKIFNPGGLVFGPTKDEAKTQADVKTQFTKLREAYIQEQKKLEAQLKQNPIITAEAITAGQKTTDEITKSSDAYFKKLDDANKKFADGIAQITNETDRLQAKLSINPVAQMFLDADKSRRDFLEKLKDVPKEFKDAFTKASQEAQALDLFKGVLGQSQNLSNIRLQIAQLEAGGNPEKLAQAKRDAIQEEIAAAQKFLAIAQNPAQRQLALERITSATSDISSLTPEQRDVRFKALNEQRTVQEQLFRENFERLKDQTAAQKDNTAALVTVGNSLVQMDSALQTIAKRESFIKIEVDNSLNSRIDRLPDNN